MDFSPEVNWRLARSIAGLGAGSLPEASRPQAHRFVAGLRQRGRQAGALAAQTMGMASLGATSIQVVDRSGWVRAATRIAQAAIDTLGWPRRAPGFRRALAASGLGAGFGVGLGVGQRRMLGQFDAFTGSRTLYLVAPNMWRVQRMHGFDEAAFQLWVSTHEQAHALQFERAAWLTDHLAALVAESGNRGAMNRIIATMTFLEGHADFIADHAPEIPGVKHMRNTFRRSRSGRGGGLFNKGAQYANGLAFCLKVRELHADDAPGSTCPLNAALDAPDNLPTRDELAHPEAWVRRVHG